MACRLDSLACQEAISDMFLNAIDGCSEDLQREIITLLPELLSENAHEVFPSACCSRPTYTSYLAPIHTLSRRTKGMQHWLEAGSRCSKLASIHARMPPLACAGLCAEAGGAL